MSIEKVNTQVTIVPKSQEDREKFYARLNDYIDLQYQIDSAKDSQKDLMEAIAEDFVENNPDVKKGDVKKRAALLIKEYLDGKATEESLLIEDVLGDYDTVKKFLK